MRRLPNTLTVLLILMDRTGGPTVTVGLAEEDVVAVLVDLGGAPQLPLRVRHVGAAVVGDLLETE